MIPLKVQYNIFLGGSSISMTIKGPQKFMSFLVLLSKAKYSNHILSGFRLLI
jgi:hypothetical protein